MDSFKETHQRTFENYIAAFNSMDGEGMIWHLAPYVISVNMTNNELNMRLERVEVFKPQIEVVISYFSERKQTIHRWEYRGEFLAARTAYQAILAADLPKGLKAGEQSILRGISEFLFEKGKLKHIKDIS